MPDPAPPAMRQHPGHFPTWPDSTTLNHLALQWLWPQGTIIDRSGWQDHGRTQYVLLEAAPPENRRSIAVITVHHAKGELHWRTETEFENPPHLRCPDRLIKRAGPLPPDQWRAVLWRTRNRDNQQRIAETRRILTQIRRNHPSGDPRLMLTDGTIVQYTQGLYRGHPTDAYWDPRNGRVIKLDHEDIDPGATLLLRNS